MEHLWHALEAGRGTMRKNQDAEDVARLGADLGGWQVRDAYYYSQITRPSGKRDGDGTELL